MRQEQFRRSLYLFAGASFLLIVGGLLWSARAQVPQVPPGCMPVESAEKYMAQQFQEGRVAAALTNGNALIELYTSDKGTWTILITRSNGQGMACILAAGNTWTDLPPAIPQSGPVYRLLPELGPEA